jgi:hypothetical protein
LLMVFVKGVKLSLCTPGRRIVEVDVQVHLFLTLGARWTLLSLEKYADTHEIRGCLWLQILFGRRLSTLCIRIQLKLQFIFIS